MMDPGRLSCIISYSFQILLSCQRTWTTHTTSVRGSYYLLLFYAFKLCINLQLSHTYITPVRYILLNSYDVTGCLQIHKSRAALARSTIPYLLLESKLYTSKRKGHEN